MSVLVYRLHGKPLKLEIRPALGLPGAGAIVGKWWAEPETVAVVVMEGLREDARYERRVIDPSELPPRWPPRKATLAEIDRGDVPAPPTTVAPPAGPPTLGESWDAVEAGPDASEPHGAPAGHGKGTPLQLRCPCCWAPWGSKYEGDRDQTPSGRQVDRRCMHCGRPQLGLTQRQLWDQYRSFQNRASDEHAKKPKPKGGMWR